MIHADNPMTKTNLFSEFREIVRATLVGSTTRSSL